MNCRLKRNKGKIECKAKGKTGKWIIDLMVHIIIIWIFSLVFMPLFTMGLLWTFVGVALIALILLVAEMGVEKALGG